MAWNAEGSEARIVRKPISDPSAVSNQPYYRAANVHAGNQQLASKRVTQTTRRTATKARLAAVSMRKSAPTVRPTPSYTHSTDSADT